MLELVPITQADLPILNKIYEQACEYFSIVQNNRIPPKPIDCLEKGDLPPNGVLENFYYLKIVRNGEIIGWIAYYRGYPDNTSAYIAYIYITERRKGYGIEIINQLIITLKQDGCKRILCAVSLNNSTAIKFWHKMGSNKIRLVDLQENYTSLELERKI